MDFVRAPIRAKQSSSNGDPARSARQLISPRPRPGSVDQPGRNKGNHRTCTAARVRFAASGAPSPHRRTRGSSVTVRAGRKGPSRGTQDGASLAQMATTGRPAPSSGTKSDRDRPSFCPPALSCSSHEARPWQPAPVEGRARVQAQAPGLATSRRGRAGPIERPRAAGRRRARPTRSANRRVGRIDPWHVLGHGHALDV